MNDYAISKNANIIRIIQEKTAIIGRGSRNDSISASEDIEQVIRYASAQTQETLRALHRAASLISKREHSKDYSPLHAHPPERIDTD